MATDIWSEDLLNRREDARFIIDYICGRIDERGAAGKIRSFVLNLDAEWGRGKTFFLKRLKSQLEEENYIAIYLNAWSTDHADHPLLAAMVEIETSLSPLFTKEPNLKKIANLVKKSGGRIAATIAIEAIKHQASKFIGEEVESLLEENIQSADQISKGKEDSKKLTGNIEKGVEKLIDGVANSVIDEYRNRTRSIERFKVSFGELANQITSVNNKKTPIFILVDELDRCRPLYAVKMLEEIKHLFDVDNVVFIVATDSTQLVHSIGAVYGHNFESRRYLARFFDRAYQFDPPNVESFIDELFSTSPKLEEILTSPFRRKNRVFFRDMAELFDLSLRDMEQTFDILRSIATIWSYHSLKIQLIWMLPLLFLHQQKRTDEFLDFSNSGKLSERIIKKAKPIVLNHIESYGKITAQTYYLEHMFTQLGQRINQPLPEISIPQSDDPFTRWMVDQFLSEYQILHSNMHSTGSPPYSILKTVYPSLVRGASRMKYIRS